MTKAKHPGGRPQEYDPKTTIEKVQEYMDSCIDEKYTLVKTEGSQSTSYENKIRVKLPTVEGLSLYLDVARDTIYDWESKFPEFSYILGKLKALQADRLLSNGISGDYNSTIAKLILTKHGYRDSQEVEHSGSVSLGEALEKLNNAIPD